MRTFAVSLCIFLCLPLSLLSGQEEVHPTSGVGFPLQVELFHPATTPVLESRNLGFHMGDSSLIARTPLQTLKLPTYRQEVEMDSTGAYFILWASHAGRTLGIPVILPIEEYVTLREAATRRQGFLKTVAGKLQTESAAGQGSQSLELIGADIAGQRVSLRVRGNVNITGKFRNEDRSQQVDVNNQFQTNSFQIEQKQAFKIEGKIGDRISIQVDQDSERDFDFENNMEIYYNGTEDEIVQKIEAGNISLNLPGTNLAMFSGQNNGLFGLKALMKGGALDITAIASLEKGKKEKKSLNGDSEARENTIEDYNRRPNQYFYLNNFFRRKAYPLDQNGNYILTGRTIRKIQVYKSITSSYQEDEESYFGYVYEHPNREGRHQESGQFKRLIQNVDYTLVEDLGFIRLKTPVQDNEVLAVAYLDTTVDPNLSNDVLTPAEYRADFPLGIDPFYNYQEGDDIALDIPNTSDTLHLKLLKMRNAGPGLPAWDLEWKNVFNLGASEINENGFDLKIKYFVEIEPIDVVPTDGTNFLELFELDRKDASGNFAPDGIIDGVENQDYINVLNLRRGELILPFLNPFMAYGVSDSLPDQDLANASGQAVGNGGNPHLVNYMDYQSTSFYDFKSGTSNYRRDNKLRLYVTYTNKSANFTLGFNVIEGSEEITLNKVPLQKGTDYNIDYFTGSLTILNEAALAPGADLEIKYELHEFFNLDKKVILGSRAEYKFGQNKESFIGLTALYFSKSSIDEKVRIGKEPLENFIWDLNTKMTYDLPWMTKGLDWLPIVKTDAPSRISLQGEIAQVIPNPNTSENRDLGDKGIAYLDDFEGSRREAKLNILRGGWRMASIPVDELDRGNRERAFTYWYNPYDRVLTKQIWPNKETSAQAQNDVTDILVLNVIPDSSFSVRDAREAPGLAWGGIMRALSSGYYDQTEAKFLEMWVRQPNNQSLGRLHVDLGSISEDLQEPGENWDVWLDGRSRRKGFNVLDTEDLPSTAFPVGDGYVTETEDVGLDGWSADHPDTLFQHPAWDTWAFDPQTRPIDYTKVNGTEGNITGEGGTYPNTEDLDGNQSLDVLNAYYTMSIDLTAETWIAGRTEYLNGTETGWKLIRIPLTEFAPAGTHNLASWDQVKYARLWMDNLPATGGSLQIATMDIVGNEWQELGVYSRYDGHEDVVEDTLQGVLNVSVINTEDNPDRYNADNSGLEAYDAPPKGVEGILDPITRLRSKEQSLVIRTDNLAPGHSVAAEKRFLDQTGKDLIHYATMKMFIHGWEPNWGEYEVTNGFTPYLTETGSQLEFFLRFGEREDSYYEVRQPIFPGWDERNHVEVNLSDLANFKLSLTDSIWVTAHAAFNEKGEKDSITFDTLTWNELSSEDQYARLLYPDGRSIAVRGNPSLSRVKLLRTGFRNRSDDPMTGEIWMDEMRVTDVERETATAYRANMSVQFANLGSVSLNVQRDDSDFHNVQQQFGSGKNSLKTSISGNLNLDKFLPEHWGLSMPLSASYRESEDQPKYISGTDIQVNNLPESLLDTLDAIRSQNQSYNWNFSLSKKSKSDHWFPKYTMDALSLKVGASNSTGSSSTSLEQFSEKLDGNLNYNLNLGKDFTVSPLGFLEFLPLVGDRLAETSISYLPTKIGFTTNLAENRTFNLARIANAKPSQKHTLTMNRNFNLDWAPLKSVSGSYKARYSNNLDSLKNRKQDILTQRDLGHLGTYSEDYNLSWNPKFGEIFQPQFSYSSQFNAIDKIDASLPGLDLSVNSRASASVSLKLVDIMGKVYEPAAGSRQTGNQPPGERKTRGRAGPAVPEPAPPQPDQDQDEKQEPPEEESFHLRDLLDLSYSALDKISPISLQVSQNQRTTNPRQIMRADTVYSDTLPGAIDTVIFRELAIDQVRYDYRLGLIQQPGFNIHPSVTNPVNLGQDINLSLRTGINFSRNLSSNLNLTLAQTQSETGRSQGVVSSSSLDYFPSGPLIGIPKDELAALGRNGLVLPSFSIRYSGLNDIEWLKKIISSASVDMDYTGKRTLRSEGGRATGEEYSAQINPRLSIQAKHQISGSISVRFSRNITNTISAGNESTSNQTYATDVNANISYQHRGGMNLKIPFMEQKRLENNIDFRLEAAYQANQQYKGSYTESTVVFDEGRFDKNLSVTPTIGYSFTDKVSGNIGYKFQVFDNKGQGRRKVGDFSFGVNIQIKG